MGKLLGFIGNLFKVSDAVNAVRTVFDSDGYLYQRNTKLTPTGAELNVLAGVTAGTAKASAGVVLDANKAITGLNIVDTTVSHDYGAAAVDWVLSATEKLAAIIKVTNASGAVNAIFDTAVPNFYLIDNQSGQALTCKKTGGTGIVVASTKRAILWMNGTDIVRITADA